MGFTNPNFEVSTQLYSVQIYLCAEHASILLSLCPGCVWRMERQMWSPGSDAAGDTVSRVDGVKQ